MAVVRNMLVRFAARFRKQYKKSGEQIVVQFDRRLELFINNLFDPVLNNHALTGKFRNYRSINITGDWRALYSEELDSDGNKVIIFEMLGTHSQLYK